MDIMYVSGSPRRKSNTEYLLKIALSVTGGRFVKLADYHIEPCTACWACLKDRECVIDDDMSSTLIPMLRHCDGVVLGSPVYFNNVSAQLKAFMDRTWCIRGALTNRIGGAVVVGQRYGAESALTAINSFFLKHEIILANRGVCGIAYEQEGILQDLEAIEAAKALGERMKELGELLGYS